eukprot:scaffold50399_cov18-Tisochrysis_lutea.AAC.3
MHDVFDSLARGRKAPGLHSNDSLVRCCIMGCNVPLPARKLAWINTWHGCLHFSVHTQSNSPSFFRVSQNFICFLCLSKLFGGIRVVLHEHNMRTCWGFIQAQKIHGQTLHSARHSLPYLYLDGTF